MPSVEDSEALKPAGRLPKGAWLAYGDAMRVFGVLAVMLVHVCDMVMFDRNVTPHNWWVANVIDATGRWAVPVFIMLSGALLLNPSRDETARRFYRRRLTRLGWPILFWSAFFMLFSVYYIRWGTPKGAWTGLMKGAPYMHLHFVFRLMGLYAITPMLRVYVRHAPWNLRAGMAGLLLALGMGNWAVTPYLRSEPTAFSSLWAFLGFYLTGDVLRQVRVTRRLFAVSAAVLAAATVAMSVGTGLLAPAPGSPEFRAGGLKAFPSTHLMLYDFLSPPRVLMSVAAWFALAYLFGRFPREAPVQRALGWLAPMTLGIYLVHPFFRDVAYWGRDAKPFFKAIVPFEGWHFTTPSVWVGIPLMTLCLAAASVGATWGIRKIPFVRRIMG